MASYFMPSPILDKDTLLDVEAKCFLVPNPPKTIKDAANPETIWAALNKIYPAWFDGSVHPKECESTQVRKILTLGL